MDNRIIAKCAQGLSLREGLASDGMLFPNGTSYFVDTTNGSDANTGKDEWKNAKKTIQAALNLCSGRGGHRVFVAPGYYAETLQTPINETAPFGTLIGISPSDISRGAVYVASGAVDEPWLTVRARGWRITGFEVECPTQTAGILLDDETADCLANYAQIDHCHLTGGFYGINALGAPTYVHIIDNEFTFIDETSGIAITSTSGINVGYWVIANNLFANNANHIRFANAQAPYNATIINNVFSAVAVPEISTDKKIYLATLGGSNIITQNYLGGAYSKAGGYEGGTSDEWFGNYADVAGGVTKDDPA